MATLIAKFGQIVVTARIPKIGAVLQRLAEKEAILDKSSMLGIKNTLSWWEQLALLESLLSHLFTVTKKLQSDDLISGRFLVE